MSDVSKICPYCETIFKKWRVPDEATWEEEFFYVCFNDNCSYYRDGWKWMKDRYNQHASFRYALNPTNGSHAPLPVWSDSALRELIVEDDEGEQK